MGTPLRGARIPRQKSLEHWAAEKCELCGHELGFEHSIRSGHGGMGYHHAVCGARYATNMLLKIRANPEQAAELAQQALEMLGNEHEEPREEPFSYWKTGDDG